MPTDDSESIVVTATITSCDSSLHFFRFLCLTVLPQSAECNPDEVKDVSILTYELTVRFLLLLFNVASQLIFYVIADPGSSE